MEKNKEEILNTIILIVGISYLVEVTLGLIIGIGYLLYTKNHKNTTQKKVSNYKTEYAHRYKKTYYTNDFNTTTSTEMQERIKISEFKGTKFENYIEGLFNENEFTIVSRTKDLMRINNTFFEEDTKPDFLIKHNSTGQEFYVECKFRSKTFENKIKWSNHEQMNRYMRFALEKRVPCFIVIGLGGSPAYPKNLFCIPIEKAKYPELYIKVVMDYYHRPGIPFKWNGETLN